MNQLHQQKTTLRGVSALTLHLLAMAFMLCDHLWATVVHGQNWLTDVGRLSFPIFTFLIAEGFAHTRDLRKYLLRLLAFAVLSEIPFNLMMGGGVFYPYHQNVLWTFLIALLCLAGMEAVRKRGLRWFITVPALAGIALLGFAAGTLGMVDYFGFGVLSVVVFYLFRGRKWWQYLGQAAGLWLINGVFMGGQVLPFTLLGQELEFPQQGLAVLALLPIWLYRGRQGPHGPAIRYACYAFYPAHILLLVLLSRLWA